MQQIAKIESPPTPKTSLPDSQKQQENRKQIAVALARLALVCPFKKMKPEHAELAMETYVGDLVAYDPLFVDVACQKWRTAPGNKFFPAIGELMAFIAPAQQRQAEHARAVAQGPPRLREPEKRPYTGAYEGWEFLSDDEKHKRIALDVAEFKAAGDPHGMVGMGKAFLKKAGWNTAGRSAPRK